MLDVKLLSYTVVWIINYILIILLLPFPFTPSTIKSLHDFTQSPSSLSSTRPDHLNTRWFGFVERKGVLSCRISGENWMLEHLINESLQSNFCQHPYGRLRQPTTQLN